MEMQLQSKVPSFRRELHLAAEEVAHLYRMAGLNRPVEDLPRVQAMLDNSNLIITARHGEQLIGIARALTDYHYCCYLSDLAVHRDFHTMGIGKKLVEEIREIIGPESKLILLAVPNAEPFYEHIGFERANNAWVIARQR